MKKYLSLVLVLILGVAVSCTKGGGDGDLDPNSALTPVDVTGHYTIVGSIANSTCPAGVDFSDITRSASLCLEQAGNKIYFLDCVIPASGGAKMLNLKSAKMIPAPQGPVVDPVVDIEPADDQDGQKPGEVGVDIVEEEELPDSVPVEDNAIMSGTITGNRFEMSGGDTFTIAGCSMSTEGSSMTGTVDGSSISGTLIFMFKASGNCEGGAADCEVTATYTGTKKRSVPAVGSELGN